MNPPSDTAFTQPSLEGITLILAPTFHGLTHAAAEEMALAVLAKALQATTHHLNRAWTVQPVTGSPSCAFDLTPLLPGVSVQEGWELTYALRAQPAVSDAEPSFITTQDDFAEMPSAEPAQAISQTLPGTAFDRLLADPVQQRDWLARAIAAPGAWNEPPRPAQEGFPPGKRRGEGIRIGHPDSGYRPHMVFSMQAPDLRERLRTDLDWDFVDHDDTTAHQDGNHGLATASVLAGNDLRAAGSVTGIAPAAELLPLRVAKRNLGLPVPVLLESGMRRLRDALYYALNDAACHVISISLGWLPHRTLHEAIQVAERQNIIVCAAAGNYVGFVVWPAAYPEVIAVAGCTAQRTPWWGSSRGPQVAISAPAQEVWVAHIDAAGQEQIIQSDGTSYAVAAVAGVAALWLAHHGRTYLLEHYRGEVTLTQVFRHLITTQADPFAHPTNPAFGAGIVNAQRILAAPLPTATAVRTALAHQPSHPFTASLPESVLDPVLATFPATPPATIRTDIAALLGTTEAAVETHLQGLSDELLFHLLTTPALRQHFTHRADLAPAASPQRDDVVPASVNERLRSALLHCPLSMHLRRQMQRTDADPFGGRPCSPATNA